MSEFTKHEPGNFSWAELGTRDQAGAKAFYTELFGWGAEDSPIGPGRFYTTFQLRGKPVAAGHTMDEAMAGVPPHWQCYVTVASADESAKKAAELGAKVLAGPFDVMAYGRMAVIEDPTGAKLSLWEAKAHFGAAIAHEASSMAWSELMTRDPAAAVKFYAGLFGWTTKEMNMGPMGTYTTFHNSEERGVGGMMKMDESMSAVPPAWQLYFGTDDCDASVERAKRMGGKVMVPATDIPGVGRFAMLADPSGAAFSIIKFAPQG